MSEVKAQLQFNLLGRILGKDSIIVQESSLKTSKKGSTFTSKSLRDCKEFATYKKGFIGGVLKVNFNNKSIKYRFLKHNDSEEFLEVLNASIAKHIKEYLSKTFNEFNTYVINEYPRDSRLKQLNMLCQTLSESFNTQSDLWEKHFNPEHIQKVKEIISFYPLNAGTLREFHEKIQLEKRRVFFDSVESNPLTSEQRQGVLRSNDVNMVLAAAGTGKTSVMVAKALDLIDRGLAKPSEILVLAYNNAAVKELQERLVDKAAKANIVLESSPQISTFHALGRKLLRDSGISTYISVFSEDEIKLKQWITSWLETYLTSNSEKMLDFISLFPEPVNPFDFKTQAEYERYVRDNEFRTLNGEKVKGYQELLIANFMYINGVPYSYEAPYVSKRRVEVGFDYRPDFHIQDTNIYIEHFGVDRKGTTRPDIDSKKYNESMKSKRTLHVECGTTLIETFHYEWIEDTLLSALKEKLTKHGISCNPLPPEEVLKKLQEEGRIANWADLMKKALQAIRVERLNKEDMVDRFEKAEISQPKKFAKLFDALHQDYVQELKDQNSIDFDDMIIRAIQVVKDGIYIPEWTYILVDEFQDISAARMEFVKSIIEKGPQPSLTAVGDDWQSIYRFSGGKLELTTRFGELVGNYTSTKLQKTFRYNNSIANTAGQFIMENPEQYKKNIETHTKVDQSQVFLLDDKVGKQDGVYERVKEVVQKIRQNDPKGSIAIIARYNYLLNDAKAVLNRSNLKANVHFWSFHKSKGLEADYCILIGFFQGRSGFPNENRDGAIIEALLPSLDSYPHSEERRLLYVGITRAKEKSYIIADPTAPSEFVTELLAPKYKLNIVSKAFQEQHREIFKCPNCEHGYLRLVKGKYGEFYTCSTGLGCKVGKARVCSHCSAPSIDTINASICNNIACGHSMKICDKCGRPMKIRNGKRGKFWGCTGFGIKEDQCKQTSNL
ncbi:MAG: AAA family ATPase [Sulfurovum sp.]|nr:AAA family ATPase [Sulfurovum sp.]